MRISLINRHGRLTAVNYHKSNGLRVAGTGTQITANLLHSEQACLITDVPGLCSRALGPMARELGLIIYSPPAHQREFMSMIASLWLSNQDICDRTETKMGGVDRWTCSPWARQHIPIPIGKFKMLKMSLQIDPLADGKGHGRKRRAGQF